MRRHRDLAIVLAIAAIAHLTYFALRYGSFYFPDSFTYLDPAKNLAHGLGFVSGTPPEPETIRTPGYPLLLILFGLRVVAVIALQHLLAIALAGALYLFVLRRLESRFAAYVAAIAFALDTPTIHMANKLLSETFFTTLLFIVFVLSVSNVETGFSLSHGGLKPAATFVIALLLGVMTLVRPIAMFFFPLIALRIPRRQLVWFVIAAVALPVAWATRNRVRAGVFTVSSVGSVNLLITRAAGALAIEDEGDDFRSDLTDEQHGLVEDANDWIQQKLHIEDADELPVAVRLKYYGGYATRIIAQHPVAFAELTVRGILVNLFDSDWDALLPVTPLYPTIVQMIVGSLAVAMIVFATVGVCALWHSDRELALLIVLTVGYFVFMSAGAEAEYRFRVPVVPQLAIAGGVGLDLVRRAVIQMDRSTHD